MRISDWSSDVCSSDLADVALYAGLSYAYILLMAFPLYNAIESLDHNQVEAARDLGAPWWRINWRVVMPHAKPGIASGCTLVFMLAARSEEHKSELQTLMRNSYAVFCLKKKKIMKHK